MQKMLQRTLSAWRRKLTPQRRIGTEPQRFLNQLNEELKKHHLHATAVLGGSYAKGTHLPGDHDIDIFVRFSKKYSDKTLASHLGKVLSKMDKAQRIHGSRDYFQIIRDGYTYEIVPVIMIKSVKEARNVTDVSPLHVGFVRKHIEKNPRLANGIRLAKQFCKSANVYGAESYINGFSGHVIDLLVIYYGSCNQFFSAVAKWQPKTVISFSEKPPAIAAEKRRGPLIVVDPIQPTRNAAAALSKEKFFLFQKQVQTFLKHPSSSFFKIKPLTKQAILRQHKDVPVVIYQLKPLLASKDIAGTKLYKAHQYVLRKTTESGFSVIASGFDFRGKQALCFLAVKEKQLSQTWLHQGPPITDEASCKRFEAAHPKAQADDQRLFVRLPRPHRTLAKSVGHTLQTEYVLKRSAGAKII